MKKTLMLLILAVFTQVLVAQEVTVQGHVTYKGDGSALAGVSVVVVGTNVGTISGADGSYTINAKMGEKIRFTFIGRNPEKLLLPPTILM